MLQISCLNSWLIWPFTLMIIIITQLFLGHIVYLCSSQYQWSLCSGHKWHYVGANKQYAPQKSCYCLSIVRLFNSRLYIIATKDDPFHPFNNPSELQGEGIFAQFVFLVYISFILNFQLQSATGQFKMQTADCRLDIKCRLQTGYKMHTEYKTLCFC